MKESLLTKEAKLPHNPFAGPEIERVIYTTQSQAEIWIACKLGNEDANRAYNESISLVLKGNLDTAAIIKALQYVMDRHESLRAVFSTDGTFMTIFKSLPITLDYKDVSTLSNSDKAVTDYLDTDANHNFNLVKGPLFKAGLLKTSETEHQLILTAHHIICDGWSFGILLEELGASYSAYITSTTPDIVAPDTFTSYAIEEQEFLETEAFENTENYWLQQYKDAVPIVNLPTDFPRPALRTFKGDRIDFALESDLVADLKKVGIQSRASFVVTLLAAFEVFLYHKTGQDDLVIGLPAAGQSSTGKTQLIGHCVNLLPLRSNLPANMSFQDYLKSRKSAIFDAYDHQQFSFGQLLQKLAITRDPSRVPLAPIMFNIDMGMTNAVAFNTLKYEVISNPRKYEAFELFLNATGTEDKLILEWSYNTALFKPETITQMMASFKEVLQAIVTDPTVTIGNSIEADYSAYNKLNTTAASYPKLPLHKLLADKSKITANKKAIQFEGATISYKNVEQQSNQLAHYLLEQGVEKGDYVAVSLARSMELVVTLIAIMKCGAAYLPLDPSYPNTRLEFMLEDSEATYLISSKSFTDSFSNSLTSKSNLLVAEEIFDKANEYPTTSLTIKVDANDLAYIMYTSGSTGNPKGVMVTHKNLVNFLYSMMQEPGISENDKLLSITTVSFDIAGLELFLPLLKGATLVIANDETAKDSRLLLELLQKENISMLQATPSTWQMLLDAGWEEKLPIKALCGGEALPMGLAKKIVSRVAELWNVYGPTETTIWSAIKRIRAEDTIISIGKPLANTQIYMLNAQSHLAAPNIVGEICIAGDGVSNGYWKRSDLTEEKFIKNPFDLESNPVLYRTGDVGKLLPTGEIQCLGRIDNQIKIRGHRIELGEIEQVIDALDGVASSVVVVKKDMLIANVLSNTISNLEDATITNWKKSISNTLPGHMVPQQFHLLSEFPKTLNGKIDRKSLIQSIDLTTSKSNFSDPETDTEKTIARIWEDCLEIETVDIQSDFFEIGGHSLIALKIMTQIEKQTGNRIPLAALLEHPTVQKLATYVDKKFISWDSLVPLQPNGTKDPFFIVHGANYNILIYKNLAKELDKDQPVYALQAKGLSGDTEAHDRVEDMATHYISEIKSVYPKGPYALGGFSFGGIIAFEMAKQLRAQGELVKTIALLDSYVYPSYYYSNPIIKKIVEKTYDVAQLIFMGLNMFSNAKNFKRRSDLLKLKFEGILLRLKHGRETQQQMQFNRTSQIDAKHQLAFERYHLIPQDTEVDLFRATKNIFFAHDYKLLGWKKIALKGIHKHMIPGNHSEMFDAPAVEVFGKKLQEVLDNATS